MAALNGLSYATTLFLMAAGLSLIFGVTRIVNFAHGSFFMLGALFSAHFLVDWCPAWADSTLLYGLALLLGTCCAALAGAAAEFLLLRRLYGAPELYQLVATFGLSLAMHDAMRWGFGPDEVFAPRVPGLKGAIAVGNNYFPQYQLVLILLGPLVWGGLHLFLHRSRWGRQLRAATQDRDMLCALGVSPAPLMLSAVALGCALAGLGGGLQLPREPAHLQMDMNVVVETFVVVVTGGLGSIAGAFWAAVLIGMVHALCISLWPQATLVLVFATMAVVLAVRPQGLLGQAVQAAPRETALPFHVVPHRTRHFAWSLAAVALAVVGAQTAGDYAQSLAVDVLIMAILGVSLQAMLALGGMVSFGHAAFFGLGAYGAALSHIFWGWSLLPALVAGMGLSLAIAALVGPVMVRSAGVYMAMLSLALAQVVWATASQWTALTGGDNGLIGLQLVRAGGASSFLYLVCGLALLSVLGLRRLSLSPFGAALQAARDAPERAAASGLPMAWLRWRVYVCSAVWAGLAGALFAAHQGAVFVSTASVSTSVDALLVLLLGGMHQLWGALAGALVLVLASAGLGREFEYWRGALGLLVMVLMVWAPSGLLSLRWRRP